MSNQYRYISELRANVTDNWTINVMVSRVWTTYNPKNNQVISLDIIIVDERRNSIHVKVPAKLMNKYKSLIVEGRVHNIHRFMVREYKMLYRPLDRKIFLEFCTVTSVRPSSLPLELFDRYVFEFIPFNMLGSRAGNDTYLTDVIGVLREWGPLGENEGETKSAHPQIRKIVVCDTRDLKLRISLWGKLALKYTDDMIRSQKDTNIIVILTSCKVRRYGEWLCLGGLQMTTTVATHFYLNLPIANCYAYNQRPIQPVDFPSNVPKPNVLTTEEINITTIPEFYERLANGVNVGTEFIISSMVIGIDLDNDWKFIQCPTCFHKVDWANVQYKLVITIGKLFHEEINCVLFNNTANELLGHTVEELLTKSIKEGAGVPYWLDDFFVDKLLGRCVVLRIKIDKYNLAPTFVRRYTATKYYGDSVDILKENSGMMLPSKVDSVNLKITDEDEKIMDEIQWGSASDCSASKSATPTIPKTTIKVPLSTVNEACDANVELSTNGSKNVLECEMNTTIIDTSEGSAANATMTNEDNLSDTHKDNETSHVHNDAVYVSIEDFKEGDKKESDMKVEMKEGDMTEVVQDADMSEEDTKEDSVKKDDMKDGEI
ncbi:replication factor A protein 1 [Artemisia annua]|uniref:Replication factor A protein 1 n=1 Tax=Artemisia annua TaxID=35608 RepID=A0A2U1P1J3_ARTAN|nr:replication factor A protein 1 [Artemisia annua]